MTQSNDQAKVPTVPIEYAGLWIAWNRAGDRIIASGRTLPDVVQAAAAVGEKEPLFAKAPKANIRFAGLFR